MSEAARLHESGIAAFRSRKLDESLRSLEHGLAASRTETDASKEAEILNDIGVVQRELGRLEDAEMTLNRAFDLFGELDDAKGQAQAMGNLANVLESQQRYAEAADAYRRSARMFEECGSGDLAMYSWQALSRLHLQHKDWLGAIATFEEGIEQMPEGSIKKGLLQRIVQLPGRWLAGR